VRFLRALEKARLRPAADRQQIAASVQAEIAPYIGSSDLDDLRGAARAVQDERWRLISAGHCKMDDVHFASVVIAEQWLRAQIELVRQAAPIAEIQAEKRRDIIEVFIRDNLYADSGEVVELQAYASVRRKDRNESSKNAA
jgi:hypothetical protein